MAKVRVNVGTDPLTGKRIKLEQTSISFDNNGWPVVLTFIVKFYESDNSTETIPSGSEIQKRATTAYEDAFLFSGHIDSTTKVIVAPDAPNAVNIKTYFETKVISSFPGVAGGDTLFKLQEGILKEVIAILQANGMLP